MIRLQRNLKNKVRDSKEKEIERKRRRKEGDEDIKVNVCIVFKCFREK